jgi:arsenite methyltransferase
VTDNFYQNHWLEIEDERLERYERMFEWRPEQSGLLEPAGIQEGLRVLDFGSGPGHLAMELARRVGEGGSVHGVDINQEFVRRAAEKAKEQDLEHIVSFLHLTGEIIPLADNSMDRVICKNVLEYVADLDATLKELRRLLVVRGIIHIIDSDWGFVVVEPWGQERTTRFFSAAAGAFKEPHIGRKLPAALSRKGFADIEVSLRPFVDRQGGGMPVLNNMASYIRTFNSMPEQELSAMMDELEEAIPAGEYLFILPQFLVTATV